MLLENHNLGFSNRKFLKLPEKQKITQIKKQHVFFSSCITLTFAIFRSLLININFFVLIFKNVQMIKPQAKITEITSTKESIEGCVGEDVAEHKSGSSGAVVSVVLIIITTILIVLGTIRWRVAMVVMIRAGVVVMPFFRGVEDFTLTF